MCSFEENTPRSDDAREYLSEAELDAMTVEELEAALALALASMTEETYDGGVIDRYLDALERKDPMPPVPDADASHAAFLQSIQAFAPERQTRSRWKRLSRVLLAALLAVLAVFGSLFTAQALGADVFGKLAQWTDEFFSFRADPLLRYAQAGAVDEIARSVDTLGEDGYDTAAYASLQDALDAYGISDVPLVPRWFPEGYGINSVLAYYDGAEQLLFYADYGDPYHPISIMITLWGSSNHSYTYFKDEESVSAYEAGGITHYLMSNNDTNTGAWMNGPFECSISGYVSQDVIREMVASIYAS